MKYEAFCVDIFQRRMQESALPPSKHFAGRRFIIAKAKEANVNKFKSKGGFNARIKITEAIFARGPARHKTASFL